MNDRRGGKNPTVQHEQKIVIETNLQGRSYMITLHKASESVYMTYHRLTEDQKGAVEDNDIPEETFKKEVFEDGKF